MTITPYWDIIIPTTSTNMVLNPTGAGGATTSITAEAGTTVALETAAGYTYLGPYSVNVITNADNEGVIYTLSALSNNAHFISLRVLGTLPAAWDWSVDNATYTAPALISTEGDWSVYALSLPAAQCNGRTTLYIHQNGAGSGSFFIGHAQVETGTGNYTTPITGELGAGYYWTGTAYNSTSVREAWARDGGIVYDLYTQYGFLPHGYPNTGTPEIERYQSTLSLMPGSLDAGYKVMPREFILAGWQQGTSYSNMHYKRKNLITILDADYVKGDQPIRLRYKGANSSKPAQIDAYYLGGMEFNEIDANVSRQAIRLRANDPYFYELYESVTHLTTSSSVANADEIVRKNSGTWANISTDFAAALRALALGKDGCVYIAGEFTNVGDANGDYIVKWNPATSALSSLSTGSTGIIYALATAPNGNIYLGGSFLNLIDANGDRVSYWNGSTFVSLSTGIGNGIVYALAFGTDGSLYVGGSFTDITDVNGDGITKWNGTAFSSLSTGLSASAYSIAVHPNGDLYVGGAFVTAGGVTCNGIAKWNGTAWSALSTGVAGGSAFVNVVAIDKAGRVYIGGDFTTAGGVTCNNIALWNGQSFEALGSGVNATVSLITIGVDNLIYIAGMFTSAGGLTLATRAAVWNGSSWAHIDLIPPGAPTVTALLAYRDNLYIGYTTAGTATTSYLNPVTNSGTARAYPRAVFKRSGGTSAVVEWLKNETTGTTNWLNYSLLDGEELTIDFRPGEQLATSNFFGSVPRAILRGSDMADFYLLPGTNQISAFVNVAGGPTMTQYLLWRNAYLSHDGVATT